jgi:hypothetical protein
MNMRYLEFYKRFHKRLSECCLSGSACLDIMDNNKGNTKEELFVESFKHGTGTLVLSKQGVELETGHEEIQSRSTGYQTHIRTKSGAQMSLVLYLCPLKIFVIGALYTQVCMGVCVCVCLREPRNLSLLVCVCEFCFE